MKSRQKFNLITYQHLIRGSSIFKESQSSLDCTSSKPKKHLVSSLRFSNTQLSLLSNQAPAHLVMSYFYTVDPNLTFLHLHYRCSVKGDGGGLAPSLWCCCPCPYRSDSSGLILHSRGTPSWSSRSPPC